MICDDAERGRDEPRQGRIRKGMAAVAMMCGVISLSCATIAPAAPDDVTTELELPRWRRPAQSHALSRPKFTKTAEPAAQTYPPQTLEVFAEAWHFATQSTLNLLGNHNQQCFTPIKAENVLEFFLLPNLETRILQLSEKEMLLAAILQQQSSDFIRPACLNPYLVNSDPNLQFGCALKPADLLSSIRKYNAGAWSYFMNMRLLCPQLLSMMGRMPDKESAEVGALVETINLNLQWIEQYVLAGASSRYMFYGLYPESFFAPLPIETAVEHCPVTFDSLALRKIQRSLREGQTVRQASDAIFNAIESMLDVEIARLQPLGLNS